MAFRVPPRLHRLALRLAQSLRLAWWRVRKPEVHGCNVVVTNPAGRVLLIRHSYQSRTAWMLPGGGIARGERAEQAAVREVAEEAGCYIFDVVPIDIETVRTSGARNHIHLFAARTDDVPIADGREIVEAAFFPPDDLPAATAGAALRRIHRALAGDAQNRLS